MKGCTTIRELEEMPNSMSHTIYKSYVDMIKDKEKAEAHAKAEAAEELVDEMT